MENLSFKAEPFDRLFGFWQTPPLMMLILLKLKYFFIAVLVLTQTVAFAGDTENPNAAILTDVNSASFPSRFPPRRQSQKTQHLFLDILEINRQMIRSQNMQIQNLLETLSTTNDSRKRDIVAQKLIELMESSNYEKMKQELDKMVILAEDDSVPIPPRIVAIKALSEHTLPNKWIDFSLMKALKNATGTKLTLIIKETQKKLKENYAITGKRFSKLYSFDSPYVRKAAVLIWIDMYENNPDIATHLRHLLSNEKPNRQAIGLLVAEKLDEYYSYPQIRDDTNIQEKIRELRSNNSHLASLSPSADSSQPKKPNRNRKSKNGTKLESTACEGEFITL